MLKRRQLLQTASVLGFCNLSIANAAEPVQAANLECDVLVLGGGIAGLSAAVSATENGAKNVMIIEKAAFPGGHVLLSGAGYWTGGTKIQQKAGIEDSVEINWQDALERGLKTNRYLRRDIAVVRKAYEEAPKDVEWLEAQGVKFVDQPVQGTGNRKRIHYFYPGIRVGSSVVIKTMKEKAESLGVKILYNTKLLSLLTKNKELGSPVVGAKVENKGKIINILAKGGVVLATGGFANSPELVAKYHPYLKGIKAYGSPLNTGDGIKAAVDIGANFIVVHSGFGMNMVSVGTQSNKSLGQPMVAVPLIVVNKQGERFTDETKGYLNANHIMVEKKWKKANWIFDSKTVKDFGENSSLKLLFNQEKIPSYSSLDELAKAQGIPPEALKETIEEYNKDVREGKDIFGKKRLLATIEEGPFYTREVEPRIYTSYSGLEINTDAEVLDVRSKAIPGLYAAGDVVGVLTWQTGLAGGGLSTIAAAVVYGRIAGAEAAKRLK